MYAKCKLDDCKYYDKGWECCSLECGPKIVRRLLAGLDLVFKDVAVCMDYECENVNGEISNNT